jgi:hypothetical protein
MTAPRFTAQGKQVLFADFHYADACSEAAAIEIARAMNAALASIPSPSVTREGGE